MPPPSGWVVTRGTAACFVSSLPPRRCHRVTAAPRRRIVLAPPTRLYPPLPRPRRSCPPRPPGNITSATGVGRPRRVVVAKACSRTIFQHGRVVPKMKCLSGKRAGCHAENYDPHEFPRGSGVCLERTTQHRTRDPRMRVPEPIRALEGSLGEHVQPEEIACWQRMATWSR